MNGSITRWTLVAILAFPHLSFAEIYKWTERGVTTYGNKPPPGAVGVRRVTDADSRVSVIPPPRAVLQEAARTRDPEARVARFEREPATSGAIGVSAFAPMSDSDRRERCFAERRVACTAPTAATYDATPSFSPYR
jgi:hypothetical protein